MFLLYQKKYKTYPETIEIDGSIYHINADFRNILRIFDMIDNEDIPVSKKFRKLKEWFFECDLPENISGETGAEAFIDFVDVERNAETFTEYVLVNEEFEKQFCYNFDAEEIYAGFISEYGIDLVDVEFLHWYKFRILLENLPPESAFKRKVELRLMDLNNLSAGNGRKFAELERAKESVQLPVRNPQAREDLQVTKEFNEIWGKAGNN
ncbi:MAG: bacteriophage Gp15 family protein [Oscillospiraceae bacterium]|nr:bacteriophage Gp15 family protein [Oscillospiraceae bacterium]